VILWMEDEEAPPTFPATVGSKKLTTSPSSSHWRVVGRATALTPTSTITSSVGGHYPTSILPEDLCGKPLIRSEERCLSSRIPPYSPEVSSRVRVALLTTGHAPVTSF
jgi:hypothetical protein